MILNVELCSNGGASGEFILKYTTEGGTVTYVSGAGQYQVFQNDIRQAEGTFEVFSKPEAVRRSEQKEALERFKEVLRRIRSENGHGE